MSKLPVTIRKPILARAIVMLTSAVIMQNAVALPQSADFNAVNGGSSFRVNGSQSTLIVSQDNRGGQFFWWWD